MIQSDFPKLMLYFVITALVPGVYSDSILHSSQVASCLPNSTVSVNYADISFDRNTGLVVYNASGTNEMVQKVQAQVSVIAYGQQVFQKTLNPCDNSTLIRQLCPIPEGTFTAAGSQQIPPECLGKIPAIAFTLPDIDIVVQLELSNLDTGSEVACVKSKVTNGKTINLPAVTGVSAVIVGASLVMAGAGAALSAGTVGSAALSPSFAMVVGWFQSIVMNGMLSVDYPPIYRSFAHNFGFAGGLIYWKPMQSAIDNFQSATGGGSIGSFQTATTASPSQRFLMRDETLAISPGNVTMPSPSMRNSTHIVSGIEEYAQMLSIPAANTFITALLIFAIAVAAIIVGILGLKVLLETWALFGTFPPKLTGFRKRYWRTLANTLTTMILLLYGVWTIWCIFQWTNDTSWAAKALAAVTWGVFTLVIVFYSVKVFVAVGKYKRRDGDTSGLYEDSDTWHKYSFLYDSYRRGLWWVFLPAIIYTFSKGVVIAAGNGHGMSQTIAQLSIETAMLALLLCTRPFATSGSNWINGVIQAVRVLSAVCILVFVEQLGISQSTKTVAGVILVVVQSALTAVLGILLAVNALRLCIVANPHVQRRKEAKRQTDQLEKGMVSDADAPRSRPSANEGFLRPNVQRPTKEASLNSLPSTADGVAHAAAYNHDDDSDFCSRQGLPMFTSNGGIPPDQKTCMWTSVLNLEAGLGSRLPYRTAHCESRMTSRQLF